MANPTLDPNTLARRKPLGEAFTTKDTLLPVLPVGRHNTTPPSLANGDEEKFQMDDAGNLLFSFGDPAQLAIFERVAAGCPMPGWTTVIDESAAPTTTVITYSYLSVLICTRTITVSGTTTTIEVT